MHARATTTTTAYICTLSSLAHQDCRRPAERPSGQRVRGTTGCGEVPWTCQARHAAAMLAAADSDPSHMAIDVVREENALPDSNLATAASSVPSEEEEEEEETWTVSSSSRPPSHVVVASCTTPVEAFSQLSVGGTSHPAAAGPVAAARGKKVGTGGPRPANLLHYYTRIIRQDPNGSPLGRMLCRIAKFHLSMV